MQDLLTQIDNLKGVVETLHSQAYEERKNYSKLITKMVEITQQARINEDYALADALRDILKESKIEIIQKTTGCVRFVDTPERLVSKNIVDTWKFIE